MSISRRQTRAVRVGSVVIGQGHPIVVQSMCATKTANKEATLAQIRTLTEAGAGIVRIAVDSRQEVDSLAAIREETEANLSVDLQENYRLAEEVAPWVDKIRYNPGHLHHSEKNRSWQDKVRFLAETADQHDCALRVGVNCGSVDPSQRELFKPDDSIGPMLASALEHCELLDSIGFTQYCVSLKDSDPTKVVEVNRRFASERPEIPLHLGVTEAGMPPEGIDKTRLAFEPLISEGIGDTIRVSLTLPNSRKQEEVESGQMILKDIAEGKIGQVTTPEGQRLQIISCPSCSRVENETFVELAFQVRELAQFAAKYPITIAVMGCRVNGPGETDDADLGLWCGPKYVNFKRNGELLGTFDYDAILPRLRQELEALIAQGG